MRKWAGAATDLETLFDAGAIGGLSDSELLARFIRREDVASSEAAFAALVARHGPMVLGICRRVLGDDHAAADAFQAVFLVLARKAPRVQVDDTLGRWLHGVSIRVSRRARAVARAERACVQALDGVDPPVDCTTSGPESLRELRSAIDEEIARLPGRYRSAVVLCYLEGLTQEQAARRLRCSIRTVETRLRRARERLRPSLARRGLAPTAWCSEMLAVATARAELPPALAAAVRRAAGASAGRVPAAVVRLARSTMRSLSMSRGLRIGWMLVALGLTAAGTTLLAVGRGASPAAPGEPTAQAGEPTAQTAPAPDANGRLEIRAVADITRRPIEGATVEWQLRINSGQYKTTKNSTDRDGRAVLEWPVGATVNGLNMTARKPGFVPYSIRWDDTSHPLHLPAVKEIRCVTGVPLGGVVKDEAGAPVAGAKITVHAPPAETEFLHYRFILGDATTDAQGRWRFDDAPTDLSDVFFKIEAPRFLQGTGTASRTTDAVTVLKRGFTVRGRVLDAQGQPIAGASVRGGDLSKGSDRMREAKTDARGEFVLENFEPGPSAVTVRAAGHAPDLRDVHAEDQPTLEFRLGPAHTVRGKVVDREGHPVAGMTIVTDTWRGSRSLDVRFDTDNDGRFEWRDAPGDNVLYGAFKNGYMNRRNFAMTADGAEAVVTVDPVLTISGKVTDAETGQSLSTFRVVRGIVSANSPRIGWLGEAAEFQGGLYTVRQSEPFAGYAVRIEAPGYKPAESRVFRPDEVAPTFDFAMARAAAADLLAGFVYRPDGRPAAGAEVALATPEHSMLFEMERFRFLNGLTIAKTDPVGRFTFNKPGGAYLVVAMSDDGYAEARPEDMAKSPRLTLAAWGKIEGRARIGGKPAADQIIAFQRRDRRPAGPGGVDTFCSVETHTDLQGNFRFDRVIPCAGEVARVVVTEFPNGMSQHVGCWQEPVDVAPGQTVLVQIGARGRPVVGHVVLQAAPGVRPVEWRQNRPVMIEKVAKPRGFNPFRGLFGKEPHESDRFAAAAGLDKDGRFRIDGVPSGHYELTVTIDAPLGLNERAPARELGRVKVPVDVPEGDADVPIDLGEIKADVQGR